MRNNRDGTAISAHSLQRFVDAQAPVYEEVCAELASGKKQSHWMWFIFPQLRELGRSDTARYFGVNGREEAIAYWRHPVLGPRLRDCAHLLLAERRRTAFEIFGSPDNIKLRSCMTLFAAVAPDEPTFDEVLNSYFSAERDPATLRLLE